jgi:hypothetical protein
MKIIYLIMSLFLAISVYADDECDCGVDMMCTSCDTKTNVCNACAPIPE